MEGFMQTKIIDTAVRICRRGFLIACSAAVSVQARSAFPVTVNSDSLISRWRFDHGSIDCVFDDIQNRNDPVYGPVAFVPGIEGTALKLDGFRSYIQRDENNLTGLSGPFTVEAWVALARYPWAWSPVLDCSAERLKGFFFGIDQEGHVGFKIGAGSSWYEAVTDVRLPLRRWSHIAAVFEPDRHLTIYVNGKKAAQIAVHGHYIPMRWGSLTIGRNRESRTWHEFQLTTPDMYFFLDGLLDELTLSGRVKSEQELRRTWTSVREFPAPALSKRDHLPRGPAGSGSFGAFYSRLDYYPEWDDMWRVSDVPDLYVRFKKSPVQLIFWRGTSFVPCWVNEKGIWYTNEWLETWGSDVVSCAEPIMDRQCRYSHVRLIENTPARVVIHWRYALSDAGYTIAAAGDDGRGEWCDEFHIIYPDMVGVRKTELHYSLPERKHDWVEQIVVLPPGISPDEVIEKSAVSLVNMSGEVHDYSWHDPDLQVEMEEPAGANISYVNLRSSYRPFIVVPPGPVETVEGSWNAPFFRTYAAKMAKGGGYRQDPVPSVYGWWNHWPVAQVVGDGRWVTIPDRPSHFNLTTFVQWNDYQRTRKTRTRIMLQGMTDKKAADLVPLAKSWLRAAKMRLTSDGYRGGTYDQAERAYCIEKTGSEKAVPCRVTVDATNDSPLINPAVIVTQWGRQPVTLFVDGNELHPGTDFRQGIRSSPYGDDLILWLRLERRKPVTLEIKQAGT